MFAAWHWFSQESAVQSGGTAVVSGILCVQHCCSVDKQSIRHVVSHRVVCFKLAGPGNDTQVPNPDIKGRTEILGSHFKNVPRAPDVDLEVRDVSLMWPWLLCFGFTVHKWCVDFCMLAALIASTEPIGLDTAGDCPRHAGLQRRGPGQPGQHCSAEGCPGQRRCRDTGAAVSLTCMLNQRGLCKFSNSFSRRTHLCCELSDCLRESDPAMVCAAA